ncbi:MAG: hypothetical protein IJ880_09435 [Bacilli bacterium]|nr:hypothetical protein [Bacilli bacterium]
MSSAIGGVADAADRAFFSGVRAKESSLTSGLNQGYDMVSDALLASGNPYAMIGGGLMKIGGLASDALTSMGVGTD